MKAFENTPCENNSLVQSESLLNEVRGNLFEYLLGQGVAARHGIGAGFESSQDPELLKQLMDYQRYMLENHPELMSKIVDLSRPCADSLVAYLNKHFDRVNGVKIIGKLSDISMKAKFGEADLILNSEAAILGVSLKMINSKGAINTKSGGAKTFLSKYFSNINGSKRLQEKFNHLVDNSFFMMTNKVCKVLGIEVSDSTDSDWRDSLESRLPGQQKPEVREIIHQAYKEMATGLHECFQSLLKEDSVSFCQSLCSLCGITSQDTISAIFQYDTNYDLVDSHFYQYNEILKDSDMMELQVDPPKRSSFDIEFTKFILQIRIKPMNEFTVPSYKINCSIKIK